MTPEPGNNLDDPLDRHLDRLMETAYEALVSADGAGGTRPSAPEPELPDHIGPYPVTGLLGRGGTSFVYRGRDPVLGRELAIKVIDRRHLPDGMLAQRFLDEARICSQLPHPGIVPIYGVGQLDDGRPYITMRLVEGDTLSALLEARADPQDRLQQFLETFARICETVAFAHARGVVHGDLKPGNVMVGAFGQVQVMDWGFSRLVDGPATRATGARVMGTPAFMAPEQAADHGAAVDARTDVFGLGAILCVILTGAPPFLGGSRSEVHVRAARAYVGDALARLRACGGDPELVALAVDCLEPAPAARPADAAAVAARVATWITSIKERAHRLEVAAAQAQVKAAEQRRTRARTVALALLGVAFAGVYAWTRFERQAHDYEARMAVVQALERARNLRAGADIAGAERMRWLGEAAQAAQQAKAFASTVGDAALRDDAEQLSQRLDDDRDAAARDEVMAKWLDDFPSHLDLTSEQLELEFAGAFRAYGADVEASPVDDVVARLRGGTIQVALARALDDWAFMRRARPGTDPAAWQRFQELALRVDEDAQRSAVRRALLAGDHDALRAFADDAAFRDAGTDTLDLLANSLVHAGHRKAAIQLWQRANARHPDSVRVIHSLAVNWIGDATCPPWDDIVRLFAAGTALQPDSAHLWMDLAYALIGQGNLAGAEAALLRALEVNPRDERALGNLVDLLRCGGKPAEALARSRALAERADADGGAGPWRVHGDALLLDGRVAEALEAHRRAVALDGTALHHERCGQCLLELGDLEGALRCFRTSIDVDSSRASGHAHLGLTLRQLGKLDEALDALEQSRAAGDAAWVQRCDGWIETTERAARAAADAPDAARGQASVEQALAAYVTGRPLAAAQAYRAVFARDAKAKAGEFLGWSLDRAAQAAARASTGAHDASSLDEEQRAEWGAQAALWLRDAIARVQRAFVAGELAPAIARHRLAAWRHVPALASLQTDVQQELAALEAALAAGEPRATLHAPFDGAYVFRLLGSLPGVLSPYGGLTFTGDADELIVAGHAQRRTASLFAVPLRRGSNGQVEGFAGAARRLAAAPFADGGIARGPKDILCYTRYPAAELGQLRPGSRGPDRVDKLPHATLGGFAFVPAGLPGAGRAKLLSWPSGEWFDAAVTTSANGVELADHRHVTTLARGPDGFAYLAGGAPPFERPAVLVAEWSVHAIATYEVDENGDPVVATRRVVVSGCRGALGLAVDPVTGDVLVSTWRGDGTEQIAILQRTGR